MSRKYTYQEVSDYFKEAGCVLLSKTYEGAHGKLSYVCKCGFETTSTFTTFNQGGRCSECKKKRLRELKQKTITEVRDELDLLGVKLFEDVYTNNKTPLKVVCVCGSVFERTLDNLRVSSKCFGCNKLFGERHPKWSTELSDEERFLTREYHAYTQWRKDVFERDSYTCGKCEHTGGDLVAHHIKSYAKFKSLRTTLENGATLCVNCHLDFHREYGFKDFTHYDFHKWTGGFSYESLSV